VILYFTLLSCNAKHETTATVIERRILPDSQLMIRYSFIVENKTIIDSVRTENRIISDSLKVIYSASDPSNNTLKFD
jgi:hypothetical protein